MYSRFLLGAALCVALALPGMARAQDTFDFENITAPPGGLAGTAITAIPVISAEAPSGRTVTLSESGVPSGQLGFSFQDNANTGSAIAYGTNLNNFVITDDGSALETLTLTFSQAVSGLTFQFATVPVTVGNPVTLSATTDNGLVFTSGTGILNATTNNNEGSLTLGVAGQTFTTLNLFLSGTASAGDTFAVDTFVVNPTVLAPVPEPGAIALLAGAGLPIVVALRRRRK